MSFSLPKNIPHFDDLHRSYEDVYWTQRQNGGGITDAMGNIFERKELPMYKDKPYNYPLSAKRPVWKRKRVLIITIFLLVILLWRYLATDQVKYGKRSGYGWPVPWPRSPGINWQRRMEDVRAAFELSWDGYERYAWGADEFHPIARTGEMQTGRSGMGYIIADTLDTLMIMKSTPRLTRAREWVRGFSPFSEDVAVSTFEATSRTLSGFLSAHYLSTEMPELAPVQKEDVGVDEEDLYIEKATELADSLHAAYADSPSGVPLSHVYIKSRKGIASKDNGGATLTAHAAGMQLEFRYIAILLGEKLFWEVAEKCIQNLDSRADSQGLVSSLVVPKTGQFITPLGELTSLTAPYYEILVKQYLQTSLQESVYQDMWSEALSSIRNKTVYSMATHLPLLGEKTPDGMSVAVEEAICKIPGLMALAATGGRTLRQARSSKSWTPEKDDEIAFSKALMKSCWALYKASPHGLAPSRSYVRIAQESLAEDSNTDFNRNGGGNLNPGEEADVSLDPTWAQNYQNSSFVESLFYLWRITEQDHYRDWGWDMFASYLNNTLTPRGDGYVALSSVSEAALRQEDVMNGLWLSRTLKFFYLLFAPVDFLPLDKVVFTSGGHVFPRVKVTRGFKTGWKRKPRRSRSSVSLSTSEREMVDSEESSQGSSYIYF